MATTLGRGSFDGGYAMAVLLVVMGVMAVMLTVVMPVWKQMGQREKEAELVFRGEQYARAIGLFQKKYANAFPPNLDVLVEQKFLRKKYKDPITNSDFVPLLQTRARRDAGAGRKQRHGPARQPHRPRAIPPPDRTDHPATPATTTGALDLGPSDGRHQRCGEQEQDTSIRLYRPQPLQRVGVRLPA
jgi:type II secretory pathway pseudopilin PulG